MDQVMWSAVLTLLAIAGLSIAPCDAAAVDGGDVELSRNKRLLPGPNDKWRCDPTLGSCRKGDWVDESIADCKYQRSWLPPYTCTASKWYEKGSWVVQPDRDDKCRPASGKRFRCGDPGTNTRCVCSDYKTKINKCICQYWTEETPGEDQPAFCTTHYLGGVITVHHWTCCNNCNDPGPTPNTCDGHTYQGGSSENYCGKCGENIAENKGQEKYYFNCGSCKVQSYCENKCNRKFVQTLPGLCWKWADCFYECCQENALLAPLLK